MATLLWFIAVALVLYGLFELAGRQAVVRGISLVVAGLLIGPLFNQIVAS